MRAIRLVRLIRLLHGQGHRPVDTLCQELDVSRRTVFRDLKTLEEAGLPCRFDRADQTYVLDRKSFLPPLQLETDEALALLTLIRKAIHPQITPGYEAALTAAMKIESTLPRDLVKHCGRLLEGMNMRYWHLSDLQSADQSLAKLQTASAEHRIVDIQYDSYYEQCGIQTRLHVYSLTFVHRGWYAIGYSETHAEVRTFKIERMVAVHLLDESFEPKEDFDIDEYFGNAWQMIRGEQAYQVVVHFSRKVADNVEEVVWHKTQSTRYLEDGRLEFEVNVDGLNEISWWILGYGKEAVVQQPQRLRELIASHAKAALAAYSDDVPDMDRKNA